MRVLILVFFSLTACSSLQRRHESLNIAENRDRFIEFSNCNVYYRGSMLTIDCKLDSTLIIEMIDTSNQVYFDTVNSVSLNTIDWLNVRDTADLEFYYFQDQFSDMDLSAFGHNKYTKNSEKKVYKMFAPFYQLLIETNTIVIDQNNLSNLEECESIQLITSNWNQYILFRNSNLILEDSCLNGMNWKKINEGFYLIK